MADFDFKIEFSPRLDSKLSTAKLRILEAVALGYTNQSAALEFEISLNAIEQSVLYLVEKYQVHDKNYYSRLRLLGELIYREDLEYTTSSQLLKAELSEDLQKTLILVCVGLSNSLIANLLGLALKTIESRITKLLDLCSVDSKFAKLENPRVLLLISALIRSNLNLKLFKRVFELTSAAKLARVLEEPEFFLEHLTKESIQVPKSSLSFEETSE